MGTMHELFDGSDTSLIDAARAAFEADAGLYGFDLTRHQCAAPEPWSEYADAATGHRWAGWLAATGMMGRDGVKRWADTDEPVEPRTESEQDPYCTCGVGDAFADEEELFSNKCKACGGQLV